MKVLHHEFSLLSLLLWFTLYSLNQVLDWFCDYRAEQGGLTDVKALPDIGLENLPQLPKWVIDVLVPIQIFYSLFYYKGFRFEEYLNLHNRLLILRLFTLPVTTFPKPSLEKGLWGDYDLMYSGHTAAMFAAAQSPFSYFIAILGALTLLCSRYHYTVDVIVAIAITQLWKHNLHYQKQIKLLTQTKEQKSDMSQINGKKIE